MTSKQLGTISKVRKLRKDRLEREYYAAVKRHKDNNAQEEALRKEYEDFLENRRKTEEALMQRVMGAANKLHIFEDMRYQHDMFIRQNDEYKEKIVEMEQKCQQSGREVEEARTAMVRAVSKDEGFDVLVKKGRADDMREALRKEEDPS